MKIKKISHWNRIEVKFLNIWCLFTRSRRFSTFLLIVHYKRRFVMLKMLSFKIWETFVSVSRTKKKRRRNEIFLRNEKRSRTWKTFVRFIDENASKIRSKITSENRSHQKNVSRIFRTTTKNVDQFKTNSRRQSKKKEKKTKIFKIILYFSFFFSFNTNRLIFSTISNEVFRQFSNFDL